MKNFQFFPDVKDYVNHVTWQVFRTKEFRDDPLYAGLIAYVIDLRTPLFFEMSDYKLERSHFTQSFGLFPTRDEYGNGMHNDSFYIHDFWHLALKYARFPRSLSFIDFMYERIDQEHAISNETEVLMYVRHPEWRQLLFSQQTILYDVLKKMGYSHWGVRDLLNFRRSLAAAEANWSLLKPQMDVGMYLQLRKYMDHMPSNYCWCGAWYQEFPNVKSPLHYGWKHGFTIDNYTDVGFHGYPVITQDQYEENLTLNVAYWYEMLYRKPPTSLDFESIPLALKDMQGGIIMPKAAQIYALALEL